MLDVGNEFPGAEMKKLLQTRNPLTNPLILSNLFKYLSIQDLCTCRLVCSQWSHETISYLRKLVKINFSAANIRNIELFNEAMRNVTTSEHDFPFINFILSVYSTSESSCNECEPYIPYPTEKFLNTYGMNIKILQLSINDFEKILEKSIVVRAWFISSLQNLNHLILAGQSSIGLENKETVAISVNEKFPQLKLLTIMDFFAERDAIRNDEEDNNGKKKYSRFNQQFLLNIFNLCTKLQELTINTLDVSSNVCALAQASINAIHINANSQNGEKLHDLRQLNFQTVINIKQLNKIITVINSYLNLDSLQIKFLQFTTSNNSIINCRNFSKENFEDWIKKQCKSQSLQNIVIDTLIKT